MTRLEIWNRALALLPHDRRVTEADDASETPSTECLRCRDHWDAARLHCLTAHDWGWATTQTAVCGGCPAPELGGEMFAYPRPAQAVKIVGIYDAHGRRLRTAYFNGSLVADKPMCFLRYIMDRRNPGEWPQWFADAVVAELASRISGEITGNAQTERRLQALALERLHYAVKTDSNETRFGGTDGMTFIKARGSGAASWRRE